LKVQVDTVRFTSKPTKEQTQEIKRRLRDSTPVDLSVQQIAEALLQGYSIIPCDGGTRESDWKSQQLFLIDCEGGLHWQENLQKAKDIGIMPAFIYSTFSDTDGTRYRMAFVCDRPITNLYTAKQIQAKLLNIFDGDTRTTDMARLYYGGNPLV
jgi:hypothetical protein